jgi:ribosomal protein S18 acetylase RimI-like enzyme
MRIGRADRVTGGWHPGVAVAGVAEGAGRLVLVGLPAVGEFTIGPIRTPRELDLACWFLLRTLPSLEARWRGPGFFHERLAGESPMMLAAKRDDEIAGVVLGHVDGDGLGTVDHLAVAAAVRGEGLGRGLLSALESGARGLGVHQLTLGSIEGAVGFYERCGYQGRLLLQFVPPARRDEVTRLFADFALLETQWQGVPQLWVQTPRVDQTLTERIRGRDGVHAQWVMDKDLNLNPPVVLSLGQRDLRDNAAIVQRSNVASIARRRVGDSARLTRGERSARPSAASRGRSDAPRM